MTPRSSFIIIVAFIAATTKSAKLPENWLRCDYKDVNECWTKAIPTALQQLTKDYPSLGLRSLAPLKLPSLLIGAGQGPVKVDQNFYNVEFYGFDKMKVEKVDFSTEKKEFRFDILVDELILKADYDLNGQVLLLPIKGKGPATITLDKMKAAGKMAFDVIEKDGKKYVKYTSVDVKCYPEKVHFNFENLFNGDKALGDNINKVLNDNDKEVFNDIKDGYEKAIGQIVLTYSNEVFSRVPLKEIFTNYE